MVIGVPRELQPGEHRAAMIPASVQKLVRAGADVVIESGLGLGAGHSDEDYATAGAHVSHDRAALLARSDLVLRLHKPPVAEIAQLKRGAIHVSYLDPFNETALIEAFVAAGVTAISMEMIPRTTRCAEDGRAQLAGQPRRLRDGDAGRRPPAAHLPDDDDAGRHPEARQRVRHRRRRRGPAGHRHRQAPGRQGRGLRHPPGGGGAGAVAGREVRRDRSRRDRPDQGRLRQGSSRRSSSKSRSRARRSRSPSPTS